MVNIGATSAIQPSQVGLAVTGLTVAYDGPPVLADVALGVRPGELVALLAFQREEVARGMTKKLETRLQGLTSKLRATEEQLDAVQSEFEAAFEQEFREAGLRLNFHPSKTECVLMFAGR